MHTTTPRTTAPGTCEVRLMVWDVWDADLADGIYHLEDPCGAPATRTVHTYCPGCGHDTHERACAWCAEAPAEFDGACPACGYGPAHYTIRPL
ncbi:hypothetical protein L1785_14485 [Antribacter sp. KLBMP9083]|uniref:Uncharacterized protein n=1 Tax=Antribacter soli TaxID=2910976 RepID=A0AA41QEV5_9MICO|nr:hypothetical protein [Antribacter soli]MCF4122185.1 hypothetical protein [Antribacter soli]